MSSLFPHLQMLRLERERESFPWPGARNQVTASSSCTHLFSPLGLGCKGRRGSRLLGQRAGGQACNHCVWRGSILNNPSLHPFLSTMSFRSCNCTEGMRLYFRNIRILRALIGKPSHFSCTVYSDFCSTSAVSLATKNMSSSFIY